MNNDNNINSTERKVGGCPEDRFGRMRACYENAQSIAQVL